MRRTLTTLALAALLSPFGGPLPIAVGAPVAGQTILVTTATDELNTDGDCSLREAITAANTNTAVDACPAGSAAAADLVQIPAGTYLLDLVGPDEDLAATGDLDITADLTVRGAGAADTIIDGDASDRIFQVLSGVHATITRLTVQNGYSPGYVNTGYHPGPGIWSAGVLDLSYVNVLSNTAGPPDVLRLTNNSGTFTYHVTARFVVYLDRATYPESAYACAPDGIIGNVSNATGFIDESTGLISMGYEAVAPGRCVLSNGDFSVTIVVTQ